MLSNLTVTYGKYLKTKSLLKYNLEAIGRMENKGYDLECQQCKDTEMTSLEKRKTAERTNEDDKTGE